MFAFADNFTLFLIAGLGFGLGDALISGALEALVFDTLKQNNKEEEFTAVNNSNQLIFNYSIVFAIIVGGLLYQYNYYLPSLLTGLAFLIAAFVSWRFIEPDIDSEKFTLRNYLLQTKMGFKELFKNQKAKDMSLFYILVGSLTWPIIISFKNYALVDLGVNERDMGFILAILSLVAVQFLHILIRRKVFEKISNILLAPSILLALILPLAIIYQVESMIPLIFVVFFSSSLRWNILGRLTNQCYSSKNRATAISSLSMLISIAYIATLVLFVLLNQITDNAVQLVMISMGIVAIVFLPIIALRLRKRYLETN
jgi:MFS family permease